MEIGLYTFAELSPDPQTGRTISPDQRMRHGFGVGEHHRPDFVVSAPAVVLGAAAARTERILLGTEVVPVRAQLSRSSGAARAEGAAPRA